MYTTIHTSSSRCYRYSQNRHDVQKQKLHSFRSCNLLTLDSLLLWKREIAYFQNFRLTVKLLFRRKHTKDYEVSMEFPSSCILKEYSDSETESVSMVKWKGVEYFTQMSPLETANLSSD